MIKYVYVLASSGKELEAMRHKLRSLFHPDIKFILLNDDYKLRGDTNIIILELDGFRNAPGQLLSRERDRVLDYLLHIKQYVSLWLTEKDINR